MISIDEYMACFKTDFKPLLIALEIVLLLTMNETKELLNTNMKGSLLQIFRKIEIVGIWIKFFSSSPDYPEA